MRTNIDIDDDLMRDALDVTGFKTKREAVNEALRALVRQRRVAGISDLFGTIEWEGDLDDIRTNKVR